MDNRKFLPIIIFGAIALFIIILFSSSIFYTIEPTQRAVMFYVFGKGLDKENIIQPGFHIKAPWNKKFVYEVAEATEEESMDVLDKNGLSIKVDVTVRFHPSYGQIGSIHEKFNQAYIQNLVRPEVRSSVRQVMGRFTAEEIYSTKRQEVENAIINETRNVLNDNNVEMTTLLIRSIILPEKIKQAIEDKLEQEQAALAYRYRLEKEQSEAERKKIAAEGEATANNIVNKSLTDQLLKMRGIEATLELSKSPNAKVVVVGSGDSGLPLILGNN